MTDETAASTTTKSWWAELPPVEKAEIWEKVAPGSCIRMLEQTDRQIRHMRRVAWAKLGLAGFGISCGFASVLLFVWLAKYYIDHHAPTQGAAIVGALAAVVAAFVGGKAIGGKRDK